MTSPTATTDLSIELASRLRLAVTRLARRLRQHAAEGDVTPSQLAALATVAHHGPITLGALAAHERVQPPSMTRIVAALEDNGLVERVVDPTDRRVARVAMTATGAELIDRTRRRKNAYVAGLLDRLDADESAVLQRAVPILERLLEEDAEAHR